MRFIKSALLASTLLSANTLTAAAEVNVVASIKPVHSLVAAVMQGVGEPGLIVDGASSPHTYALKPSQAAILQDADVVFWIGHELEAFLEKPLEAIAGKAKTVELIDAHDLVKLEFREGGAFEKHGHDSEEEHGKDEHGEHDHDKETKSEHNHDDHDHDKEAKAEHSHDEHDHDEKAKAEHNHDDHDHDKEAKAEHNHNDHEGHDHGSFDPHVWLDPVNAKALVHEIEETLAEADPENAAKYEANAEAVSQKLDTLIEEIKAELEPVKTKGFIVFHDAYQNFENRFGLSAIGSITVSPEVLPGAERVSNLQDKVKDLSATCVFSEPQFEPKIVATVTEGTNAKTGVLDPLGAEIENGPELYFELIRKMAVSFKNCLSASS